MGAAAFMVIVDVRVIDPLPYIIFINYLPILLECIDVKEATFYKQKIRLVFG